MSSDRVAFGANSIAITGVACRLPGAADKDAYWRNLCNGVESVRRFSRQELRAMGLGDQLVDDPTYVWASGYLEGVETFDAAFFGYSPREAGLIDPQHRLFLETAWEALEDAGRPPHGAAETIGVFAGCGINKYLLHHLFGNPEAPAYEGWDLGLPPGSTPDALPSRLAYKFGLTGPSVAVQTACSSSLSAVCLASDSLRDFRCDIAVAGGVSVELPAFPGYRSRPGGLLSRDGRCRPYDAAATGSVFGSGAGVVILRRLEDALADGDHVYAVVRGWAINNDGSDRAGYEAPGVSGQAAVAFEALESAGLTPDDVQLVEGHGSATRVGDPIEVAALTRVFRSAPRPEEPCWLGSVKGNIGHLDAAAGVASLVKVAMSIESGVIPPTMHFERPNPQIDFDNSPFAVVSRLEPWSREVTRRAMVTSFGMGGTNACAVLEEAPASGRQPRRRPCELLVVSARGEADLSEAVSRLGRALHGSAHALADVGLTLAAGREAMDVRTALVARDVGDAARILSSAPSERIATRTVPRGRRAPVCFMFPGVGDQYTDLALDLYRTEDVFRTEFDRCTAVLRTVLRTDLRDSLYPSGEWRRPWTEEEAGSEPQVDLRAMLRPDPGSATDQNLVQTVLGQPATFAVEYCLARQLMAWGVEPHSLVGHSVGEYAAACIAGVFDIEDALRVIGERARLIDKLPRGGMLAVPLPEREVLGLLRPGLVVGTVNTPSLCVLSGLQEAIDEVEAELTERGVKSRRLRVSHPFHSEFMDVIRPDVAALMSAIPLRPPGIPLVSCVTGGWISAEEAVDPGYWTAHVGRAVRFSDAVETLANDPELLYVEVGPGQGLCSFVQQAVSGQDDIRARVISTLQPYYAHGSSVRSLQQAVGRLWLAGASVDLRRMYSGTRTGRVSLPTYPFQRRRYWVDRPSTSAPADPGGQPRGRAAGHPDATGTTNTAAPGPAEPSPRGGHARPQLHVEYVAPRTSRERELAAMWCDLFGYSEIGVLDDFFELGGHSLLALQLSNRVWRDWNVHVDLGVIMQHPTVDRLAAALDHGTAHVAVAARAAPSEAAGPPPTGPGTPAAGGDGSLLDALSPADGDRAAGLVVEHLLGRLRTWLARDVQADDHLGEQDRALIAGDLLGMVRRELGMPIHPAEIDAHPSARTLGDHLAGQWRRWRRDLQAFSTGRRSTPASTAIGPAAFILSTPRSGSTLLRVMLAGHPGLFCPPEFHLLAYSTMAERRSGEHGPARNQGIERALMELMRADAGRAQEVIDDFERRDVSTRTVFRYIAAQAEPRLLVDKSPGNARYRETLEHIERVVTSPRYVCLVRHPHAVIESIVRNRFTQLMNAGNLDPFEFGEHVWARYNVNIVEFAKELDADRCCLVRYEDLVRDPSGVMQEICRTLGVPFTEEVLRPYQGRRMRDGLGDPNFLEHSGIESELGERWRDLVLPRRLNRFTRQLAGELGYDVD